jgi:hypothetical protein
MDMLIPIHQSLDHVFGHNHIRTSNQCFTRQLLTIEMNDHPSRILLVYTIPVSRESNVIDAAVLIISHFIVHKFEYRSFNTGGLVSPLLFSFLHSFAVLYRNVRYLISSLCLLSYHCLCIVIFVVPSERLFIRKRNTIMGFFSIDSVEPNFVFCFSQLDMMMDTAVKQQADSNSQASVTPTERNALLQKLYERVVHEPRLNFTLTCPL